MSTSEENSGIIKPFAMRLRDIKQKVNLIVFKNSEHVHGPVAALKKKVVSTWVTESYIFCLADIVFWDNLFIIPISNHNWLLCSHRITDRSGVVTTKDNFASHLYDNPKEAPHEKGMNWTGTACFDGRAAEILLSLSNPAKLTNLEEFINLSIEIGNDWQVITTSNFVNINRYQDFLDLMCVSCQLVAQLRNQYFNPR